MNDAVPNHWSIPLMPGLFLKPTMLFQASQQGCFCCTCVYCSLQLFHILIRLKLVHFMPSCKVCAGLCLDVLCMLTGTWFEFIWYLGSCCGMSSMSASLEPGATIARSPALFVHEHVTLDCLTHA